MMEKEQELEWAEAQKIVISVDLVAAAKQQLRFLAEVDKHQQLYDGPALDRAICRYKYCWLPLLAKHSQAQVTEGPLVVPLDCEWIWHCHRLNPVQYIKDCRELYGKILGSKNVVSSTQATCMNHTEEIWNRMYPNEPYNLNMDTQMSTDGVNNVVQSTNYDLISAVKRQTPFYYQVSRPHMKDDSFLEGSVARYKGFLLLIKRNKERSISQFCVPLYDIDLIWHSHQLQPVAYCKDLVAIMGRVLEHDDTDSDRTKGNKLDVGFSTTTQQWEETFGSRYWRAGAMYRGRAPSSLTVNLSNENQNMIQIPKKKFVEVMVEVVGIRDLPAGHEGNLVVIFGKKQPDMLFHGKTRLSILQGTEEKQIAVFQCESAGELVFTLISYQPAVLLAASPSKVMGTTSVPLQDLMKPASPLWVEKWFELKPDSETVCSQPTNLRIAISTTPPFMLDVVNVGGCIASDCGGHHGGEDTLKSSGCSSCGGGCGGGGGGCKGNGGGGGCKCNNDGGYGGEDALKSSGCGGCGGGCQGGGCRGNCGGGCHAPCGPTASEIE